ncbi:MAG: response regulator [Alphaproteobacteria bacterium]|nr:response regulator [Alphaproteobacteria bacterium]
MARVLVIDDDRLFSALMRRALDQHGHDVVLAVDGKSARESFAAQSFDAIVCDIVLPDETGLQILRDLRQSAPQTALIAVSGGKSAGRSIHIDVLHLAETMGVDAVVKKPFELSNFVFTVEGALDKKRQELPPQVANRSAIRPG